MPATLDIAESGTALLAIEDAKGETHSYQCVPAPAGIYAWACDLERVGEEGHGPYRVGVFRTGRWRCDCPAFKYRKSKEGPRACKHVDSIKPLLTFMRRHLPAGGDHA